MNLEHFTAAVSAAKMYALSDPSDPFAYNRARSHIDNGLVDMTEGHFYSADPELETRLTEKGDEYKVIVYRNVRRP